MVNLINAPVNAEEAEVVTETEVETETEGSSTRDSRSIPTQTDRLENRQTALEDRIENRTTALDERREAVEGRQAIQQARAEERTDAREIRQETRQEVLTERREALTELRQQRIRNLAANLSNRLEAAISRLFQIVERTESRLLKLEATGVDVSTAKASLRRASASLTEAKSLMANIDVRVNAATTSNTPHLAWQPIKEQYAKVAELIRQAHRELRQALAEAKNALAAFNNNRGVSEAVRSNPSETPLSE